MLKWKQTDAPTIVSATLFRYNYIDFRFWNLIKNDLNWQYAGTNSILISRRQVKMAIELNYPNEINLIKVSNLENFQEHSNSIYFIWQLITNYPNLKYFMFILDGNAMYSRVVNTNVGKVLRFNYRFMQATIRLTDVWDRETIRRINPILRRFNLLDKEPNKPYKKIFAQDMISILDGLTMGGFNDDLDIDTKVSNEIILFLDEIDDKFENDNPMILLVTDYLE